jgi:endonuclease/exonuclease/phosphatase family metal-dependent hydrolase
MANKRKLPLRILQWIVKPLAIIALLSLLISYLSPFIHPNTIWWLPLFGLAFPVIFWINITCFGLLLLFKKNKLKWFILTAIILGVPLNTRYLAVGGEKKEKANHTALQLMSYNVRLFDKYEWIGNQSFTPRDSILALFKKEKPAILCLQEYLKDQSSNPFISTKSIQEANNFTHVHERVVQEARNIQFGLATYSQFPILNKGNVFNAEDQDQFCIFSDILIGTDTIRVYNIHLQSIRFQKEDYQVVSANNEVVEKRIERIKNMLRKVKNAYGPRVLQAETIIAHINQSPYPVIACGDFNDTPLSYVYHIFNQQLADAFRKASFGVGRTYAGKIPAGRIDYIFASSFFRPLNFSIQKEIFSDHFAITATLEFMK